MHCLIEYILHFLFYGIRTLFCICIYVVFTFIVLLKSTSTYVNLGLWAILVVSGKNPEPATIMQSWKSHQIHRNNFRKRHCLLAYSLPLSYIACFTEITVCGHCWTVSCKVMFTFWNPNASNILSKSVSCCLEIRCMSLGRKVILRRAVV